MFGALLGIGAGLLGGIFSRPKKPKPLPPPPPPPPPQIIKVVETANRIDFKALAEDARAAGYNPITALRYGGAAGFQITNTPFLTTNPAFTNWEANYNTVRANHATQEEYRQARGNWLGGIISGIGSQIGSAVTRWGNQKDAAYRRSLENELLKSEISRNDRLGRYDLQPSQAVAPSAEWHEPQGRPSGINPSAYPDEWTTGEVTVTNPWLNADVDPNWADAEAVEARYSDGISLGYGFLLAGTDGVRNVRNASYHYSTAPNRNDVRTKVIAGIRRVVDPWSVVAVDTAIALPRYLANGRTRPQYSQHPNNAHAGGSGW